jgi:hypothetical protein
MYSERWLGKYISESWIHGRGSSAGVATSYVLEVPGSISLHFQFLDATVFLCINVFPVFHSFSFLMYHLLHYVLIFSHSVHSVLLMYYCLRTVHCLSNTATKHRPNCTQ